MKFFAVLAAVSAVAGVVGQFQINTPSNVVVCEPILFSWSGGTPPYFLSILPGGQPSAAALVDLGQQQGTSYTWTVTEPAGTSLGLTLRDSTGATVESAPFSVESGSDTSCLNGSSGASGAASSTSSGSSASSSSAAASTTAASTTAASTGSASTTSHATSTAPSGSSTHASSSGTASASAASTSSSTGAASAQVAQIGVAALAGAFVAAIVA